ncbi:hypothetical protein I3J27_26500 [Bradyrhizobium xenonodulans]|uniref:Uncharacterized protein n=1 Tax=Bradyrhizobium xenonodulans TaxID=2736875 RepID=A0ABY7MDS6_9BRAD|nr:hypothetical protein [Bradyrhizobium xenonodulans]WBL76560.1 hypothetical protein I3J27_26500 [Bradyrhizobium xenonodulans]
MRSILTLSVLISLCAVANAATVHHGHHRHAVHRSHHHMMYPSGRASGFAYAPRQYYRSAPYYQGYSEPYYGASQGYAPGEKQRFLESVLNPY